MADVVLDNTTAELTGATVVQTSGSPTTGSLVKFTDSQTVATATAAANSKLLGSGAAGSGSPYTELTLGTNLSMSGTTLNAAGSSASGLVLLESHTASASATLNFTTRNASGQSGATFQTDYDEYEIRFINVVPATDNVVFVWRASHNAGVAYDTASSSYFYFIRYELGDNSAGGFNDGSYGTTFGVVADAVDTSNGAGLIGVCGVMRLWNPTNAEKHKWHSEVTYANNANLLCVERSSGWVAATTAVDACQFLMSSGNITSGTIRIYGVSK